MGVLDSVLRFKEIEQAKKQADVRTIQNSLALIQESRKNNQLVEVEKQRLSADMAKSGFRFNQATGGFEPDEGLMDTLGIGDKAKPTVASVKGGLLQEFLEGDELNERQQKVLSTVLDESGKSKIETKILEAVGKRLGVNGDAAGEDEAGLKLPPGTSINVGGVTLPVVAKKSASQEKREVETKQLSDELQGLFLAFSKAREEGTALLGEAFGATGPVGRIAGKVAGVAGRVGISPAIDVFNAKRKAFATVVAKAAGEVRPTDVDIERFKETLMSTERSDEENELIMADLLRKVQTGDRAGLRKLWENATGRKIKAASVDDSSPKGGLEIFSVEQIGE